MLAMLKGAVGKGDRAAPALCKFQLDPFLCTLSLAILVEI